MSEPSTHDDEPTGNMPRGRDDELDDVLSESALESVTGGVRSSTQNLLTF